MDIEDIPQSIATKSDFASFLKELHRDLREGDEWENATLESFLEALAAYVDDAGLADDCDWKEFAKTLLAARVYE